MKTFRMLLLAIGLGFSAAGVAAQQRSDEPAELVRARQAYEAQMRTVTAPVRAQYLRQLEELKAKASAKGASGDLIALVDEINKVRDDAGMPLAFDWKKVRGQTRYNYLNAASFGNSVGYSDLDHSKLLDGAVGEKWGEATSAGWLKVDPSPILFSFARPMVPSAIGFYFFQSSVSGGVAMPKTIRIYKGGKAARAELIGETSKIPDVTGWCEIPLSLKTPTDKILVEIESPGSAWTIIDEVRFK